MCEGTKTEPNYFEAFKTVNHNSFTYNIEAEGCGLNTLGVVKKAIELRKKAQIPYDVVWAVFDKDDFPANDFNNAIMLAEANNINVAWSNEAFELWYLLHFEYRNTYMSRDDYKKAISNAINSSPSWKNKTPYSYKKNNPDNYQIMSFYGNQNDAIRNAKKLNELFDGCNYHEHNPCTTVYKLVLQLLNQDEELKDKVMKIINSENNE